MKYLLVIFFNSILILSAREKPNIIFIFTDDLGYGDIQSLNSEKGKIPTPHIDSLAHEGISFTDAHTSSSVCTPSRYSLLTGRYNWRSSLQKAVLGNPEKALIPEARLTLGSMLQTQGYETTCIGKWHLGFKFDAPANFKRKKIDWSSGYPVGTKILHGPITRGFDNYYGFHHARSMRTLIEDEQIIAEIEVIDMLPKLEDYAVKYINEYRKSKQEKPFFLYMALGSPHTPIVPSLKFQGKSPLGPYGDFVMQSDATVGAVLNALKENGLDKNTILIFSSDNGCSKAADIDKLIQMGHYPSAQFRGSKADLWEGGHRVPFIIRWPNGPIKAGTKSDELISLVDVAATFADILQIKLPENQAEDSFSFLAALSGKTLNTQRKGIIHHSIWGKFAFRNKQYKLLLTPGSGGWSSPNDKEAILAGLPNIQLYDISVDPGETNNLINQKPELAASLQKELETYVKQGRTRPGSGSSNDVDVDILK